MSLLSTLRNVITALQGGDRKDLPARERMSVPLGIRRLEERRVLNADLVAALAPVDMGAVSAVDAAPEHAGQAQTAGAEILFIDSGVENWHELAIGVREGVEVVLLSSDSDGLTQIAHHLEGRSDLAAIHIVSHGDSGTLLLGNSVVTQENLGDYRSQLQTIAGSLSSTGDLLLYGCEVGSGMRGEGFLDALSELTRSDVAASTNLTGASFLGGDWELEVSAGEIEADIAFTLETQFGYAGVFASNATVELNANGDLVLTDSGANNDDLSVSITATHVQFLSAAGIITATGGLTDHNASANIVSIAIGDITGGDIFVNTLGGDDSIIFAGAAPTLGVSITVNGGDGIDTVQFESDITFAAGKSLDVTADTINVGVNANLATLGTGAVTFTAARNIALGFGSSITTVNGGITLSANQQDDATSGSFVGIGLNNALVEVAGTGALTVEGRGGDAGINQYGVSVTGGGKIVGGTAGLATVTGTGGASAGNNNYGVFVNGANSSITSGGGAVAVTGTGGAGASNNNYGVYVLGAGASITSGGGNVEVTGTGGGGGASINNIGVHVRTGGVVTNGAGGLVTVTGTGGASAGDGNFGVFVNETNSQITSGGGAIAVIGTGGGVDGSSGNYGVYVLHGSIASETNADVTVTGQGGNLSGTGSGNMGVLINQAQITSAGGAVLVDGTGGGGANGDSNRGVEVSIGGLISATGVGDVTVIGRGGNSSGSFNHGVRVANADARIQSGSGELQITGVAGNGIDRFGLLIESAGLVESTAGDITLIADSMGLMSTNSITAGASQTVTLTQQTAGYAINLGGADSSTELGLTDIELDRITAGTIVIGNAASGAITVSGIISRSTATDLVLQSGGDILLNPGGINTNGGDLLLDSGAGSGAVDALRPGHDVNVGATGTLSLTGNLASTINGTAVDSGYSQLNVSGAVDLSGVDLILTGNHVPVMGQTFTIVSAGSITGQFNGLSDGDTLVFNSETLQINYTATSVVLSLFAETQVEIVGGVLTISDIAGTDSDDTLTITVDPNDSEYVLITDPNQSLRATGDVVQEDKHTVRVWITDLSGGQIVINGGNGDDSLTVDASLAATGLSVVYNGGGQAGAGDVLRLTGTGVETVEYTFVNENDGGVNLKVGANTLNVTYTGLEPVFDNTDAVHRVFTYSNATESIVVSDAVANDGLMTIDSNFGESVTFAVPTGSLTINAGGGNDTITIAGVDSLYNASLIITGDAGTDLVHLNSSITFAGDATLSVEAETINVATGATLTTSGAAGTITLTADTMAIDGNLASAATVTLQQQTSARQIFVGTENTGRLSLTDAELDRITAGTIIIGSSGNTGAITVTGSLDRATATDLELRSAGAIAISAGMAIDTAGGDFTVVTSSSFVMNAGSDIATAGGDVDLTTTGAVTLSDVDSSGGTGGDITVTAGTSITLSANRQILSGGGDVSLLAGTTISLSSGATTRIDSAGGDIRLESGTSSTDHITVGNQAEILSAGGMVTLDAGGNFALSTDAAITTNGGAILIDAVRSVTLTGRLDSSGGTGGDITVTAGTSFALGANRAILSGGGAIGIQAGTTVTLASGVDTRIESSGGAIGISANATSGTAVTVGNDVQIVSGAGAIGIEGGAGVTFNTRSRITSTTGNIGVTSGDNFHLTFSGLAQISSGDGQVTLTTRGTGNLVSGTETHDVIAASVAISTGTGVIGASNNAFAVSTDSLTTTTTGNNTQFLTGTATIGAEGLNAGTGVIDLQSGIFTLGGSDRIANTSFLHLRNATAELDLNEHDLQVAGVQLTDGNITGPGVLTSASDFDVRSGSISAVLAGADASVGLTKTTNGVVVLSGVNTYTGLTTITAGTLRLDGNDVIADASGVHVVGTLDLFGNDVSVDGLTGTGTVTNTGAVQSTLTVGAGGGNGNYTGVINNGTGGVAFTKAGAGTQVFSGNSTNLYMGQTTVAGGVLELARGGTDRSIASGGSVEIQNGGTLRLAGSSEQIGNTVSVQVDGTFDLNGLNETLVGLTGTGIVTNNSAGPSLATLIINDAGGSSTFSGVIQDGAIDKQLALTKTGAGTFVLSGANTYSGLTNISGGTLQLGNHNALADETTVQINSGATFDVANFNDEVAGVQLVSGNITGSGVLTSASDFDVRSGSIGAILAGSDSSVGLTKTTGGIVVLSGVNTYTGLTTITTGTLQLAGNDVIADASDVHVVGTLDLFGNAVSVDALTGTGTVTNTHATDVSTLILGADGGSGNFGGVILTGTGGVAVTKTGGGTQTFSGSGINTYTGPTTVSAGVLELAKGGTNRSIANGSLVNVESGGTLRLGNHHQISDLVVVDVEGTFDLNGWSDTIGNLEGNLTGTGLVTNSAATVSELTVGGDGNDVVFHGVIEDGLNGAVTLTKAGAGSLTLDHDSNSFSTLKILAGTTTVDVDHAGGLTVGSGTNTFNTSGLVTLNVANDVTLATAANVGSLDINAATIDVGANITTTNGGVTLTGAVLLTPSTVTIATGDTGGVTVNGAINGAMADRSLTINAGTQAISLDDVGTSLALTNLSLTGVVTVDGAIVSTGLATFNVGSTNHLSLTNVANNFNTIVITSANDVSLRDVDDFVLGSTTTAGDLTLQVGATFSATQSAAMNVGENLVLTGAGAVVLSQNNVVGGNAIVQSGTLQLNSAGSLANDNSVYLAADGELDLWTNKTLAALTGQGTVTRGTAGLATLTINDLGSDTLFGGVIENPVAGATLALTKLGSGTLTLTNDHTYTGATTVSAGTLRIGLAASLTGTATTVNGTGTLDVDGEVTGNVTVQAGGTLDVEGQVTGDVSVNGVGSLAHVASAGDIVGNVTVGTNSILDVDGTVTGNVTVNNLGRLQGTDGFLNGIVTISNGGRFAPGDSPGQITVAHLDFNPGGIFDVEINGTTTPGVDYDQVIVTGSIDLTGAVLQLSGTATGVPAYTILTLIDNQSGDYNSGAFNGIADAARVTFNGEEYRLFYNGGVNTADNTDGNELVLIRNLDDNFVVFVDDDWAGTIVGTVMPGTDIDPLTFGDQNAMFGINAFAGLREAVEAVNPTGTIHVAAGEYLHTGILDINKAVTIIGAGIDETQIFKAGPPTGNFDEAIRITASGVTIEHAQLGWEGGSSGLNYYGYVVFVGRTDHAPISDITLDYLWFDGRTYRSAVVLENVDNVDVTNSLFTGTWGRAAVRDGEDGSATNFNISYNEFREDHYRHGPIAFGPHGTFGNPNNYAFSGVISFNYFASGLDFDFQEGGDQNYVVTFTNRDLAADGLEILHNTFDWRDLEKINSVGNHAVPIGVYFDPSLTVPANSVVIQDNIFNGFVYMGPQADDGPLWLEDGRVAGNGALELDGDGDFGVFQDPVFDDIGESGTISLWVSVDTLNQRHMLVGGPLEFQVRHSNNVYFYPGESDTLTMSNATLTAGTWTHLTFTWDHATQSAVIYINGSPIASYSAGGPGNINWSDIRDTANKLIYIGRDPGNPGPSPGGGSGGRDFDGKMDDLAFFDRALSNGEVNDLFNVHSGNAQALGVGADLIAYWDFNTAISGNVVTSTVGGVDLQLVTNGVLPFGPTHVENGGVFGDALSFDGVDDFATWRDASFDVGEQGTLNFWVLMESTGRRNQFFEGPGNGGLEMQYRTNGGGQVYGRTSESGDYVIRSGGDGALLNNTWYNIQYTWDFTSGEMRIYIDGAESAYLAGSTPTDLAWTTVVDTVNGLMSMGRDPGDATRNFDGLMDDVAWFNEVLTTAQRDAIRTSGVSQAQTNLGGDLNTLTNGGNLVAHWSFEDGTYNAGAGTFSGDSGTAITLYLQQLPPAPLIQGYSVVAPLAAVINNNVMYASDDYYANGTGEYADSNHGQAAIDANNINGETANPFFEIDDPNGPTLPPNATLADILALRFGSAAAYQSTEFQEWEQDQGGYTGPTDAHGFPLIPHIGAYQGIPTTDGVEDVVVSGSTGDDLLVVTMTGEDAGYYDLVHHVGDAVHEQVFDRVYFGALDELNSLTFNGYDGDDVMILILPDGGAIGVAGGIFFNGGNAGDGVNEALSPDLGELLGDVFLLLPPADATVIDTIDYVFGDPIPASDVLNDGHTGEITLTQGAVSTLITYTGVEPIYDQLQASNRTFTSGVTAPFENETITLSAFERDVEFPDFDGVGTPNDYTPPTTDPVAFDNRITAVNGGTNSLVDVRFNNPEVVLTLNASAGNDVIDVASVAPGFEAALEIFGDGDNDLVEFTENTSTGRILVDAEQVIVRANVAVSTTNSDPDGDLTFTNTTTITMEAGSSISTGTGNVAMDATGDITMDSSSTITAGTGTVSLISSTGNIHVSQISSTTQVSLEATAGAITDNHDDEVDNVAAATVLLTAANGIGDHTGTLGNDDDLDINAGTLTATNTNSGRIQIHETDNVAIVSVTNAGRAVVIDAGGQITDADSSDDTASNIVAASLAIRAVFGIGNVATDGQDLDIEVDTLSASTTTGDIFLSDVTGGLEIAPNIGGQSGVTTSGGTGDIHIRKQGAGANLVVNAAVQNLGTGQITLESLGNTNTDNLIVNQPILSTSGDITLRADNDVTLNVDGDVASTSGNVTITADRNGDNTGALFMANGALVNAGTGRIDLDAAGNITLGGLLTTNDTAAAVTIDSRLGGVIDGGDAHVDIVANSANAVVTINAATGIGVTAGAGADPRLETTLANLVAHVTGTGGINLLESDSLQLQDVDTANGTITVETTNGNITATDVESSTDNDTNDIRLTANGSILVTLVKAGSQNDVFLTATNTIVNTDAATDASVQADDLIIDAANAAGAGDGIAVSLKTQVNDLSAVVTGGGQGDLEIFEVDDINLATSDATSDAEILSTTNGEIRVIVGGSIVVFDTAAGNEGGGLNDDPEISAQGANGRIALTAGADFTLQDNAQVEASQITDGAVKIAAGGNVEFGSNVQINTGSGVGVARLISPRPEMSTPPSGPGTAFYDASSILAPTITSIGGGNYQAKLTFHIGAAGEQGLVIHIDWSDFSEPGSERFQEFTTLSGDTVFSTTHNYTETDLLNAFFNGRTSAADPMTVIFSVSFHPSIVIIGDTVTPPGGGTPNDVNGNLLSSTDNPLTGDNPNPDFPTGTPFENGVARFTLPSLDAMPPIFITPPSFTTFETPTVTDAVEQIVTTPIITTDNGASVASFAVGRDEYLELRVLSPDPEAAPLAVRRLPDEFLAGNEGASFTELFDGLPDGTYEIWYVLGGNRQQIIRVEVRNGKSILQTDELDGGPLFLEEIRDRLRDQLDTSDASGRDATDPDAAELRMLLGKVESIASESTVTATVDVLESEGAVESILRAASLPGVGDAVLPTVVEDEITEDVAPASEDAEPVGATVPAAMAAGLGMQRLMRGRRSNPFSASRRTARRLREILDRQE